MNTLNADNQRIDITGNNNTRHFGGYITQEGCVLNTKLIRSGVPDNVTLNDIVHLKKEYNLKNIIDLRTDFETEHRPSITDIKGINYYHIPYKLQEKPKKSVDMDKYKNFWLFVYESHGGYEGVLRNFGTDYVEAFTSQYTIQALKKIFRLLINETEGATLFHCSGGKDRTGMISLLFLIMLGVEWSVIVEDYMMTNILNKDFLDHELQSVMKHTQDPDIIKGIEMILLAHSQNLDKVVQAMKKEFGTWNHYFQEALDITPQDIELLKKIYTT